MGTLVGNIKASSRMTPGGGYVMLMFDSPIANTGLYLPPHMAACAAMIVEAFNAHMATPEPGLPTGGVPTSRVMGLAVALANLPEHHDDYAAMHAVEGHDADL